MYHSVIMPVFVLDDEETAMPAYNIIALRKLKKLPSFDASLVDDRWSARLHNEACRQKVAPCAGGTGTTIQQLTSAPPTISAHQKYAAALAVGKDLASLAAEVDTTACNEGWPSSSTSSGAGLITQAFEWLVNVSTNV